MSPEHRQTLLCLSALLRYPDAEFMDTLQSLREGDPVPLETLPATALEFVDYACSGSKLQLQSVYVNTFDTDAKACLYLSAHVYGDSPLQGKAMAGLHALYRDAGFIPLPGELPDYLPLVLEFLSVGPDWACHNLCQLFAPAVEKMSQHLRHHHNPYAPLLHSATDVLQAHAPQSTHKEYA